MTLKEAISNSPGIIDVSDNTIEIILINRSLNGAVDYNVNHKENLELCIADLLFEQLVNPDFGEGDLNIKYNRQTMYDRARLIYSRYGEDDKLKELESSSKPPQIWGVKW